MVPPVPSAKDPIEPPTKMGADALLVAGASVAVLHWIVLPAGVKGGSGRDTYGSDIGSGIGECPLQSRG